MKPETCTVTIRIEAAPARVYEFVHDPWNFERWAHALFPSPERVEDEWVVHLASGSAVLEFAPLNEEGVLDYTLRFESGDTAVVHMRVNPVGEAGSISLVLVREDDEDAAEFGARADAVSADLARLKAVIEQDEAQARHALPPKDPSADGEQPGGASG